MKISFYRLNVIQVDLPPLSERPEDVRLLAGSMLDFFSAQNHKTFSGFSEKAMQILIAYAWPGNIRELRNTWSKEPSFSAPGAK